MKDHALVLPVISGVGMYRCAFSRIAFRKVTWLTEGSCWISFVPSSEIHFKLKVRNKFPHIDRLTHIRVLKDILGPTLESLRREIYCATVNLHFPLVRIVFAKVYISYFEISSFSGHPRARSILSWEADSIALSQFVVLLIRRVSMHPINRDDVGRRMSTLRGKA
jgi:hypothetical protein